MAKGFWNAGVAVLFERAPDIDAIADALRPSFSVARVEPEPDDEPGWMGGNPFAVVPFRPEVNGHVLVDVLGSPWPDDMGDPSTDVALFGAWSMGFFGPFAFPSCLQRAIALATTCPRAAELAPQHAAFVRVKSTYVLGAGDDARVIPDDYDALEELRFVTRVARALLDVGGARAYFNPNGEVLLDASTLDDIQRFHAENDQVPLELWSNVRLIRPEDPAWRVMDTIGMEQLGVQDLEACFPAERFDPGEVARFLRNLGYYLLERGPVIKSGETTTGPGNIAWRAHAAEEALLPASRSTLRWHPADTALPLWAREDLA